MDENLEVENKDEEVNEYRVLISDSESFPESDNECNNNVDDELSGNDGPTNESMDESDNSIGSRIRYEISSDLGPYWDLQNITFSMPETDLVLSMITNYSDL